MNCPKCNTPVIDGMRFCQSCGAALPQTDENAQANSELDFSTVVLTEEELNANAPQQPAYEAPQQFDYQAPAQNIYESAQQYSYSAPASKAPAAKLPKNCGMFKFFLLGIVTFGIYPIITMTKISNQINIIATPRDGNSTMNFCLVTFVFSWLTLGIVPLVWINKLCARIKSEISYRNIDYRFGAGSFWLWGVLGSCILVGPFIFYHKFFKAMNLVKEHYNIYG